MVSTREIRKQFLDFFVERKHKLISSDSLVPKDDPTVLFTTAGMQQFVPYLMGKKHPNGKKLCSVQKCVRTVDIEEVGDNRHLTYFEMLGNWSLGDYFKKEAIEMSYEFLTKHLKIDPKKIWITVFGGDKDIKLDSESVEIWQSVGIPKEKIIPVGPKKGNRKSRGDNFWGPAGSTGPCGPSSEMFVYIGKQPPKRNQTPATDEQNFIEVWNDVFMEYHQSEDGKLTKLSQNNVDTGMGLERMVMVMNGHPTVFETDAFASVIKETEKISGKKYPPYGGNTDEANEITRAMRVIADHTKSATHITADGGVPSNEGRGYVLRRLVRRAVRFGRKLGIEKPFLSEIAKAHIIAFSEFYPELKSRQEVILSTLTIEEEKFLETLDRGEKILEEILAKNPRKISGENAFTLFDTYGFPLDLTKDIAGEQGIQVDEKGFEAEMKKQKERSRGAKGEFFDRRALGWEQFSSLKPTKFVGYDNYKKPIKAKIISWKIVVESDFVNFALDKTPFYAESGGQVSDTGLVKNRITSKEGWIEVTGVRKLDNGVFVHTGIVQGGIEFKEGDTVEVEINASRREQIRRHHSLAHLLQLALREILGDHVEQQGSLVTEDRTRFDFSHPRSVKPEELRNIEQRIMDSVTAADDVEIVEMSLAQAKKKGAIALFSEKYGEKVRTIHMGESFELCGGTHVNNTAEIGAITILSESSVASGIRRMELICAETSQKMLWGQNDALHRVSDRLKTNPDKLEDRVGSLLKERKELENKASQAEQKLVRYETDEFFALQKEIKKKKVVCEPIPTGDAKRVGAIARELLNRGIDVAAMFTRDGSVAIATKKGISAKDILQKITSFAGGNGGGGDQFAQGAKVNLEEFQKIRKVVEKAISSK